MNCNICGVEADLFDHALVLKRYSVRYYRCAACGFIQTETPYWLDEAYSSAIARQDVGIMQRNLLNRQLTSAVLNLLYPDVANAVDYGAGHGIFVRLMRDNGFNFMWHEPNASNDYARGFEYRANENCNFLTAFEVLEHLPNPVADISEMMKISDNVFVSTLLVPKAAPKIPDWWYYMPSSGQHGSFYTLESLRLLAKRFGRALLSRHSYHLFTTTPRSSFRFRLATNPKSARRINRFYRRTSMIPADFEAMTR
jgi:hypothetical protein